jgi:hypothetical protein
MTNECCTEMSSLATMEQSYRSQNLVTTMLNWSSNTTAQSISNLEGYRCVASISSGVLEIT